MDFKNNPHNFFNTNLLFNPHGFYISSAGLLNFCWGYEKHHWSCCFNNIQEIALSIPNFRLLLLYIILIKCSVIARKMCILTLLFKQHRIIVYPVIPSLGKLHIRKLSYRHLPVMIHDKQGCSTLFITPEKVYHPSVPPDIWTVVLATISMSEKEAITFVLVHFKEELKMNNYISNPPDQSSRAGSNPLVVGIDPHEDILGVVFLLNNTIIKGFSIPNCSKQHFDNLIADALSKSSNVAFVIESTNVFWRPLFRYFTKTLFYLLKHKLFHPQSLSKMDPEKLSEIIRKVSHDKYTNKVKQLVSLANNSTGISEGKKAFETTLKLLATFYQFLETMLDFMELKSISPILETVPNKFSTIKGFSKIAQASFISELGNPKKFDNADDVLAFFGLDPSLGQSGRRNGQGKHISKAGSKFARETMFLAATTVMLHNPVFKQRYQRLRKQGRHYIDAKTILAADLTKICFAMYRDNSEFDSNKVI